MLMVYYFTALLLLPVVAPETTWGVKAVTASKRLPVPQQAQVVAEAKPKSEAAGTFLASQSQSAEKTSDKTFRVRFDVQTTAGTQNFTVLVHEDWAPIGAARFRELVDAKFYDDTRCVAGVGVACIVAGV